MPWYKISQNNSGGVFDKEKGEVLFIKSKDLEQANAAYEKYVLDKDTFVYCECCGSRWQYEVTKEDEVTVESVLLDYARDKRRDVAIRFLNAKTGDIVDFKQAADTGAFRS